MTNQISSDGKVIVVSVISTGQRLSVFIRMIRLDITLSV